MHSLPLFLKLDGQPVILIGEGEMAQAKRRLILRAGGLPVEEWDEGAREARIAFIALEDGIAASEAVTRLHARGMLVNAADMPDLCDFTTPAIVDRDPVIIAISSGGASSGLAAVLRQRMEDWLPSSIGALATALKGAKQAMRARWRDGGERRRALARALAPGGMLDPFGERSDVDAWLEHGGDARTSIQRTIRLTSADPDDLTIGDARALGMADCILHPPGTPPAILARARADAMRIEAGPETPWPEGQDGLVLRIDITAL